MRAVLVDAGPLVALLDADDVHHRRCVAALKKIRDPLVSVWPPLVEAMSLMRFSARAQDALWQLLESGTAERERIDRVFTLDKRDFSVYRIAGRKRLELVP